MRQKDRPMVLGICTTSNEKVETASKSKQYSKTIIVHEFFY